MNLFPYETFSFRTDLSPTQIKHALKRLSATVQGELPAFTRSYPAFIAEFSGQHFRLDLDVDPRSTVQPEVSGVIAETDGGSTVNVKVRMNRYLLGLFLIWLVWIEFTAVMLAYDNIVHHHLEPGPFVLNGLFLLGYGLLLRWFKRQSFASRDLFTQLLGQGG